MANPNKQNDKNTNALNATPDKNKQRIGTDPKQPSNADYDYRPDFGESGGGTEHNPELKTDTVQNPAPKTLDKPIDKPKSTK